jgi:succinate dehydrogenase/fumarate reductase flavoprotein subunit
MAWVINTVVGLSWRETPNPTICDGQRFGYRPPRRCDKEFVQFHPAAVARDVIVLSSTTEKTLDSREDLHIFNLVFASSDLKN